MEDQLQKAECCALIVTYNIDFLIEHQIKTIRNLCEDRVAVYIIENSSDEEVSKRIIRKCLDNKVLYKKLQSEETGSWGHAMALNYAYADLSMKYKYILTLDHDVVPFKKFKICSDFYLRGLRQERGSHIYMAPAYCVFDTDVIDFMDFAPNSIDGQFMDTGALTYTWIKNLDKEKIQLVEEDHRRKGSDSFHSIIDDTFFHVIRGCNWAGGAYHWNGQGVLTTEQFEQRKQNVISEFNKISEYKIKL